MFDCVTLLGRPFCEFIAGALVIIVIVAIMILLLAITLLVIAFRQVRKLHIPEGADFFQTMRIIPITVPLALDLLDFLFDIFSAPVSWLILEAMGLKSLQLVTVTEGFIPGTQVLPTMTLAWIVARLTKPSAPSAVELRMRERASRARLERRAASSRRVEGGYSGDDSGAGYTEYGEEE